LGAPTPQPDLERHPRTRITRLPYLAIVVIALIVVGVIGVVTMRERETQPNEMVGIQVTPAPATAPASPTAAPAR
jgi:hypothetical protein